MHSDAELDFTQSITGRSISEINYLARPNRSSGAGFIAEDEDIISVIKGDNRLIRKMGLIQGDIIRPLFHFWNMVVEGEKNNHMLNDSIMMKGLFYNNYFIDVIPKLEVNGCFTAHNISDPNRYGSRGRRGGTSIYFDYVKTMANMKTTLNSKGGGMSISYKT